MAKVLIDVGCALCKEKLKFPDNMTVPKFLISFLQFDETHERCEIMERRMIEDAQRVVAEQEADKAPKEEPDSALLGQKKKKERR